MIQRHKVRCHIIVLTCSGILAYFKKDKKKEMKQNTVRHQHIITEDRTSQYCMEDSKT